MFLDRAWSINVRILVLVNSFLMEIVSSFYMRIMCVLTKKIGLENDGLPGGVRVGGALVKEEGG